jgi:hypothetical protein
MTNIVKQGKKKKGKFNGAVGHRPNCVQIGQSAYSIFKMLYAELPYWSQNLFPDLATQDVQLLH